MKTLIISTLAVVMLCLTANAATLAYWRLEEGPNGSTHTTDLDGYFVDSSGNGNNMSTWYYPAPVSDVLFSTVPQTGVTNERALSFMRQAIEWMPTPNGQYLETYGAPIETNDFTSGFTVECIAKVRTYNWMVVVSKDGKPVPSLEISPIKILFRYDNHPNPKISPTFIDTANNVRELYSTFGYELDKWYCIAVVCNGSSASLYIKEEGDAGYDLEDTVAVSGGMIDVTGKWSIARGMWDNIKTDNIYGSIDEVRICDYALAPNQFLAASGGAAVTPVAYWRFEEGTNGVHQGNLDGYYKDSSGNGNHMSTEINETRSTANNDVPFAFVPQTLQTNLMAREFVGTVEKVNNIGTFSAETSAKSVESAHLTSFTVECMAKPSVVAWQVPISKDGEPGWLKHEWIDQSFCVKFRNDSPTDNKIGVQFWDANTNLVYLITTWNYETAKWYQIAAVYDDSTKEASLYIKKEGDNDYTLEASTTTCWTPGNPPISGGLINQTYPWTIGRGMHWGEARDTFQGTVDEVRISDVALLPSQFLGVVPEPCLIVIYYLSFVIFYRRK